MSQMQFEHGGKSEEGSPQKGGSTQVHYGLGTVK